MNIGTSVRKVRWECFLVIASLEPRETEAFFYGGGAGGRARRRSNPCTRLTDS